MSLKRTSTTAPANISAPPTFPWSPIPRDQPECQSTQQPRTCNRSTCSVRQPYIPENLSNEAANTVCQQEPPAPKIRSTQTPTPRIAGKLNAICLHPPKCTNSGVTSRHHSWWAKAVGVRSKAGRIGANTNCKPVRIPVTIRMERVATGNPVEIVRLTQAWLCSIKVRQK
jgi:hypothetical protein